MGQREVLAVHAFSVLSCLSHKIQRSSDGLIRTRCLAKTLFIDLYTIFSLIGFSEEMLHLYS